MLIFKLRGGNLLADQNIHKQDRKMIGKVGNMDDTLEHNKQLKILENVSSDDSEFIDAAQTTELEDMLALT